MEKDEGEAIYAEIGSPHPRTAGAASAGTRLLAHPQQTSVTTSVPNQHRPLPQAPASDEGQEDNIPIQETLLGIPYMYAIEAYSGFYFQGDVSR